MRHKRTIAVVTGSRAEFGLLRPVMEAVAAEPSLALRVIVTGLHLTRGTWRDVAKSFAVDAKVPMQRVGEVGYAADVAALGRGVTNLGRRFAAIQPDFVMVLGDRVEAFAAASAAAVGGVRVAHLHGGDRAEGVADESMRHAISKLAHMHFPATRLSRDRLIRMGERPGCVFNVGSPAIDGLRGVRPATAEDRPRVIVLQHPIGASDLQERKWMQGTLAATRGRRRLLLAPNSDPGSEGIRTALHATGEKVVEHLPIDEFRALLAGADVIVGNSSAGLIEAAALKTPCVNVGPRQGGRERPRSVVDCNYGCHAVRDAVARALEIDRARITHPYGDGRTGKRVARILARVEMGSVPVRKRNVY